MLLPHLSFVPIKQTSSFFQKEKYNSFQYYIYLKTMILLKFDALLGKHP